MNEFIERDESIGTSFDSEKDQRMVRGSFQNDALRRERLTFVHPLRVPKESKSKEKRREWEVNI